MSLIFSHQRSPDLEFIVTTVCVSTCRYHAFDNTRKDTEDNTQVPELMEKVEELITDNQGLLFKRKREGNWVNNARPSPCRLVL